MSEEYLQDNLEHDNTTDAIVGTSDIAINVLKFTDKLHHLKNMIIINMHY